MQRYHGTWLLVALLSLVVSCGLGSAEETDAIGGFSADPATTTTTEADVVMSEPSDSGPDEPPADGDDDRLDPADRNTEEGGELPPLPTTSDPCLEPVEFEHVTTVSVIIEPYGFEFRGEQRPVAFGLSSPDALTADDAVIWVLPVLFSAGMDRVSWPPCRAIAPGRFPPMRCSCGRG